MSTPPLIESLLDNGNNCLRMIKANNKKSALSIINTMVSEINSHMRSARYGIQYDIYRYLCTLSKANKGKHSEFGFSDDIPTLEFKPVKLLEVDESVVDDIQKAEAYINHLIDHSKDFISAMCNKRNDYITRNRKLLNRLTQNNSTIVLNDNVIEYNKEDYIKDLTDRKSVV